MTGHCTTHCVILVTARERSKYSEMALKALELRRDPSVRYRYLKAIGKMRLSANAESTTTKG